MPGYHEHAFDERDAEILRASTRERDATEGPRVGDFVRMPDGELRRFTHEWDDGFQTTIRANVDTSFYLGRDGRVSFSGSLDRTIARERIEATDETKDGRFWFFHHGEVGAHRGVDAMTPCRVYRVVA